MILCWFHKNIVDFGTPSKSGGRQIGKPKSAKRRQQTQKNIGALHFGVSWNRPFSRIASDWSFDVFCRCLIDCWSRYFELLSNVLTGLLLNWASVLNRILKMFIIELTADGQGYDSNLPSSNKIKRDQTRSRNRSPSTNRHTPHGETNHENAEPQTRGGGGVTPHGVFNDILLFLYIYTYIHIYIYTYIALWYVFVYSSALFIVTLLVPQGYP